MGTLYLLHVVRYIDKDRQVKYYKEKMYCIWPAGKPSDRRIEAVTRDVRKLLRTGGWERLVFGREICRREREMAADRDTNPGPASIRIFDREFQW